MNSRSFWESQFWVFLPGESDGCEKKITTINWAHSLFKKIWLKISAKYFSYGSSTAWFCSTLDMSVTGKPANPKGYWWRESIFFSRRAFKTHDNSWHSKIQSDCVAKKAKQQNIINLLTYLTIIENTETQIQLQKQRIEDMAQHSQQIKLLMYIPGIGPILSATILVEISYFNGFNKPTQLVAFTGIDPSVKQSGKFKSSRNRMSKRGSRLLRWAL